MSGDYSRQTFDPRQDVAGVFMQQGRVQVDAVWNELVDVIARRLQAGSLDTFGGAVVPSVTPEGFEITPSAGALKIGRGRIYVDGLLAENHGSGSDRWDERLAESFGSGAVTYAQQPYLPNAPNLPAGTATHLVYLDVWQRELTSVERPGFIDKAIRVDTNTKTQTVWQVKVLPDVGAVTKTTPLQNIPKWVEATRRSDGRLTTLEVPVANDPNPCSPRAQGGYRGLENQLYRVEIHEGGAPGTATFKWSRDNATVATRVTAIPDTSHLVVESLGKDDVLGFAEGDWIEILDDGIELRNELGDVRQISPVNGIDKASRTITLTAALASFTANPNGVDQARNIRIRKWDSDGAITVPAGATTVTLENGIAVEFSVAAAGGKFRRGDHWTFAARTADASIEILSAAPPRGTHHHYAALAAVTFPNGVVDLRTFWPPAFAPAPAASDHGGCGCSVCVSPDGHAKGSGTLQAAIDTIAKTGGTVCVAAGQYTLTQPLQLSGGASVRIVGQGWQSVIVAPHGKPAIAVDESTDIVIERLLLFAEPGAGMPAVVTLRNCTEVTISDCSIVATTKAGTATQTAIGLVGYQMGLRVLRNIFVAPRAVARLQDRKDPYLLTRGVAIEDNRMMCQDAAIVFDAPAMHYLDTRISGNTIKGAASSGIVATGAALNESSIEISGNNIVVDGTGIVVATSSTRIKDNDISGGKTANADGIAIAPGLSRKIDGLQIVGNRIHDVTGSAIALRAPIMWAAIKRNNIRSAGGGIVMEEGGMAGHLAIDNNRIESIGGASNEKDAAAIGVRLQKVDRADVVGNAISRIGVAAVQGSQRVGVQTIGCASVRVSGNRITAIGPPGEFVGSGTGVEVLSPFVRVDVNENIVQRSGGRVDQMQPAEWRALDIGGEPAGMKIIGKQSMLARSKYAVAVVGKETTTVIERSAPGQVSVRGNQLRAELSRTSAVHVSGASTCTFSENQCDAVGAANREPVVNIEQVDAVVANGNHLSGMRRLPAMTVTGQVATMVGNIASGDLRLNGQPLPAPFASLNAIVP
jgi:hypothetical protein